MTPAIGFPAILSGPQAPAGERQPGDPGTISGPFPGDAGYRKPGRSRVLAAAAAVVILGVTGITGLLIVLHRQASPAVTAPPVSTASRLAGSSSPGGPAAASPGRPASASRGAARPARWTAAVPVGPPALLGAVHVTGLACATTSICYAADSGGSVLALHSAGDWPVAATDANGGLAAISCASAQFCLALDTGGYSIAFSRGSWGGPMLVGTGSGTLTSVSCAAPTFCMAVDSIGVGFRYGGPAAGWSQSTVDPTGHPLNSVSCSSDSDCVAVSAAGDVFRYNGTAWSAADPVDRGHDLVSVSCPNEAFCMAVDSAGLAAEWAAGQWTLRPIEPGAVSVSCPTQGTCLAGYQSGSVSRYAGGQWSAPSAVDPGASISQLSCYSVNACTAIDDRDRALFYGPAAAG